MATKKLIEQINRIKSLFTEERLYGNLVEQKEELDNIGRNDIIGTTDNIKLIKVTNSKFKIKPNGDKNLFKYEGDKVYPDKFILPDVKSIFSDKIGLDLDQYDFKIKRERDSGGRLLNDVIVFTITPKTKETEPESTTADTTKKEPETPTSDTTKKEPESTTADTTKNIVGTPDPDLESTKKEPETPTADTTKTKETEPVSPTADSTKTEPAVKYGGGSLAGKSFSTDNNNVKKINTSLQSGFEYYVDTKSKDVYKVKNNKIDTVYKYNESFNINLLYKNVLNEDWSKINEAYYTVGNSDKKMSDKFYNIAQKALASTETETDKSDTKELPEYQKDENWKKYPCLSKDNYYRYNFNDHPGYVYYDIDPEKGKNFREFYANGEYLCYENIDKQLLKDVKLKFSCEGGKLKLDSKDPFVFVDIDVPGQKSNNEKTLLNDNWKDYPCITKNNKYKKQTNPKGIDYYYKVGNPNILYYSNGTYYDGTSDVPKYVDYNCDDIK